MVLAVGGLDPSASAGILADVRTFEAFKVLPAGVATALTVQSGAGCLRSQAVAPDVVTEQIDEIFRVLRPRVVKVGQVPSTALVMVLVKALRERSAKLVLDPVALASGGGTLAPKSVVSALRKQLLPLTDLLTVNLHEAASLSGFPVHDLLSMQQAAAALLEAGAGAVVVKGGHLRGDPCDLLLERGQRPRVFRGSRLANVRRGLHGSGCAFAAAAAASLALGNSAPGAVVAARRHVRSLLRGAVCFPGSRLLRAPR